MTFFLNRVAKEILRLRERARVCVCQREMIWMRANTFVKLILHQLTMCDYANYNVCKTPWVPLHSQINFNNNNHNHIFILNISLPNPLFFIVQAEPGACRQKAVLSSELLLFIWNERHLYIYTMYAQPSECLVLSIPQFLMSFPFLLIPLVYP